MWSPVRPVALSGGSAVRAALLERTVLGRVPGDDGAEPRGYRLLALRCGRGRHWGLRLQRGFAPGTRTRGERLRVSWADSRLTAPMT